MLFSENKIYKKNRTNIGYKIAFFITLLVAILLLAFIVFHPISTKNLDQGEQIRSEGQGYDSPEACMEAYMEYMKNGDYQGMLSCFSIESTVENYDMEKYVENMECLIPNMLIINNEDTLSTELNRAELNTKVYNNIRNAIWRLCGQEFYGNGIPVELSDYGNAKELLEENTASGMGNVLAKMKYNGIVDVYENLIPEDNRTKVEEVKEKFEKKQMEALDVDGYESFLADLSVGKDDYYFSADLVEYDGKWYISPLNASGFYGFWMEFNIQFGGISLQQEIDL